MNKLKLKLSKIWDIISTAVVLITILYVIYLTLPLSSPPQYKYNNVSGKDTTAILGDGKYKIFNIPSDRGSVAMNTWVSDYVSQEEIMSGAEKYRQVDNIAYITGREGFCVINTDTNLCKLYLYDMSDSPVRHTKIVNDNDIVYLESFDDFTPEEQEQLKKTEASRGDYSTFFVYSILFLFIAIPVLIITSFITFIYNIFSYILKHIRLHI